MGRNRKRAKTSGTKACKCTVCHLEHPSTVPGKKHRRCGGAVDAPIKAKRAERQGVRGVWK